MTRSPHRRARTLALAGFFAGAAAAGASPDEKVPVPAPPAFDQDDPSLYGQQLAVYNDQRNAGWVDEVAQGRMTLFDADGDSVERSFSRMVLEGAQAGDRLIIRFASPAEIKGVAALTHENSGSSDDNWLYLPANQRVRRISGANNTASFQGTEFTYEDLSNLDPHEYAWRFVRETTIRRGDEEIPVFQLTARPTYADTGYSKLVVYLHRTAWRQERVEYFDLAGKLLKTRESSGWLQHHERFWRAHRIEMANHQTGKRTLLEIGKTFLDLSRYRSSRTNQPRPNLTPAVFTTRSLAR